MSVSQNFGALRVVRVYSGHQHANATTGLTEKYPAGWLPEERLVHLLTRRETTIGRALSNDLILVDPTVSREHARLVLNEQGWRVYNITEQNVVRVNSRLVPAGASLPMQPQDLLVIGSTVLQLVAPQKAASASKNSQDETAESTLADLYPIAQANGASSDGHEHKLTQEQLSKLIVPPTEKPVAFQELTTTGEEDEATSWSGSENLLGMGVTMQFALSQRLGSRMRWFIAGVGLAILIVCVVLTIVLNSLIGISVFTHEGPLSLLATLTIPLIPALGINLLINFVDRFEREPWYLRLAAFLWGAIIAILPTYFIENQIDAFITNMLGSDASTMLQSLLHGLNAGFTEETIKGLGLLLLYILLRDEFDNVTDGIIYGALIGAGFAMVENFLYFAPNSSKDTLVVLIIGRIVLGWLSHSTFTVCFGAGLGYIRHTRVRWRQIVVPLVGYLCAVGLHTAFDFVNNFVTQLLITAPSNATVTTFSLVAVFGDYVPLFVVQIILIYILIRSLGHEAAVIREFLAPEVSSGVVTVDEYVLLQNSFARTKEERRVLRNSGVKQWLRVRALYQTEIGLAFRKWHVNMGDKPKLGYVQPEDAYRRRIKRLRQGIGVAAQAKK